MRSKEEKILKLFFEHPTKEWHFEEILKEAKITRGKAAGWLRRLIRKGLIRKIKLRGSMPHYTSNYDSPEYKNQKKIFALTCMHKSGLLNHLLSLQKAKTIILFGSFSRSDWHEGSDIDIFIYGDPEGLKIADYELRLHRDIQLFICQNKEEAAKLGEGLLRNIIKGGTLKGRLDFIKVGVNA